MAGPLTPADMIGGPPPATPVAAPLPEGPAPAMVQTAEDNTSNPPPLDVVTTKDGVKRYPLRYQGETRLVPLDKVTSALEAGYTETSQEEIDYETAKNEYNERVGKGFARDLGTAAIGAAETALGVPALLSNLLPGVEGESGSSVLAKMSKYVLSATGEEHNIEDIERDFRIFKQEAPTAHMGGQVVGAIAGTKGMGALANTMTKGTAILQSANAVRTGIVAENMLGSVVFANEEAFQQKKELTGEMIAWSSLAGAAGPLTLGVGSKAVGSMAKGVAGKIDASRLKGYQKSVRGFEESVPAAQKAYDKVVKAESSAMSSAQLALDKAQAAEFKAVGAAKAKLESAISKQSALAGKRVKLGDYKKKGRSEATAKADDAVEDARAALEKAQSTGTSPAAKSAQARLNALTEKQGTSTVGRRLEDLEFAKEGASGLKKPTSIADLFGSREVSRKAQLGLIDEIAGAGGKIGTGAARMGSAAARYSARRMSGAARRKAGIGGGIDSVPGAIAMGVGFAVDSFAGFMAGGAAMRLAGKYGPSVGGYVLKSASNRLRDLSNSAAHGALNALTKTPKMVAMDVSKEAYRAVLAEIMIDSQQYTDAVLRDEMFLVDSIGENYQGLATAAPQMIGQMTQQHLRTAAHLQEHMPRTKPRNQMQPYGERTQPPLGELESYARRVRAVHNPLVILNDLEAGGLHADTVDAVKAVYPSMYLDMQMEVMRVLSEQERDLTRKEEMQMDTFFHDKGSVYAAYAPKYQARIQAINAEMQEKEQSQRPAPSRQGKGGGSNPSLAQSMRTTSQRLMSGERS